MIDAMDGVGGAITEYLQPLPHAEPSSLSDVVSLSPLAQAKILEQLAADQNGAADKLDVVEDNSDYLDIDAVTGLNNVQTRAATSN